MLVHGLDRHKQKIFKSFLLFSFFIRVMYFSTRPVFESGPDSISYIPASLDFAHKSFFSKSISSLPTYPSGYPFINSLIIRLFKSHWIWVVQLSQSFCFIVGVYLLAKVITRVVGEGVGFTTGVLFAFSPAWLVVNGECMYETYLFFFMTLQLYIFYLISNRNIEECKFLSVSFSSISGFVIVLHPRMAPIVVCVFAYFLIKIPMSVYLKMTQISLFTSLPFIFAFRNYLAFHIFSLSTATVPAYRYGHTIKGICVSLASCLKSSISNSPLNFFVESLRNFAYFWTPFSGPLKRGTWFHNLSILHFLDLTKLHTFDLFLSFFLSLIGFFGFMAGIFMLFNNHKLLATYAFSAVLVLNVTDAVIYGDSRHRLIANIFIVPTFANLIINAKNRYVRFKIRWPNQHS